MNLFDWLPLFPWEGLPLPRFLGLYWAAVLPKAASLPKLPALKRYVSEITEETSLTEQALTTYSNREEITFPDGFDPDTLMPKRIVIHRETKTR